MNEGKQLLSGNEESDYVINVVIKATDRIGSSTLLWMNATVRANWSAFLAKIIKIIKDNMVKLFFLISICDR